MTIEELFRDEKNPRHGWALRNTLMTRGDRFDRLLLVLTLAYWLLLGMGLVAMAGDAPSMWSSTNRPGACGLFFIGKKRLRRLQLTVAQALAALLEALFAESKNWGQVSQKAAG